MRRRKEKQHNQIMKTLRSVATVSLVLAAVSFGAVGCKSHEHMHDSEAASATPAGSGKPYPLDKCVVSDEKLGEHGKPYVFVHNGQEIKLCCKDCLADFNKDPEKYMAKLNASK